jgi:hypothetical protein
MNSRFALGRMMPFVRRRPLARAAVIGGGAYAVGKHMEKKKENQTYNEVEPEAQQAQQMASQAYGAQPASAPAPSKGLSDDSLSDPARPSRVRQVSSRACSAFSWPFQTSISHILDLIQCSYSNLPGQALRSEVWFPQLPGPARGRNPPAFA